MQNLFSRRSECKVAEITYRWTRGSIGTSLPLTRYVKEGVSQSHSDLFCSLTKNTELQIIRNNPKLILIVGNSY